MKVFIMISLFLVCLAPAPAREESGPVIVRKAAGPIFIDGNLDEPDWQRARRVGTFLVHPTREPESEDLTEAWVLWDEVNLYIAFRCQDRHISAERTQRNSDVSQDDCVEAFLSPFPARPRVYTNIEINVLGTYLSRMIQDEPIEAVRGAPGVADPESLRPHWHPPGLQIGRSHSGTINDDADTDAWWIIEFSLPFRALRYLGLTEPPRPGDEWRFNLFRLGGRTDSFRRNLFYIPEGKSNHSPEHFGRLVFSETTW